MLCVEQHENSGNDGRIFRLELIMDRLTSLTVFGRVVECGGFSAAARRLNMSVTMVSSHVQALEDRLGARLLNRTTRKVSVTEVGKAYYERSSRILQDLEDADRIAGALQATPRGPLRLHASPALVRFLAPILAEFLDRYPAVSIDLTTGDKMVDLIEDGHDIVIRATPLPDSGLVVRRLTAWRHVLCCAPAYLTSYPTPQEPSDLAHHNCLRYTFYPFGEEWRFEGEDGNPVSVKVAGNVVTNSAETLRLMALLGRGIFLAPSFVIADNIAAGDLVPLLPGHRPVEFAINAIYQSRNHLSTKIRAFIDILIEQFARHRSWMAGTDLTVSHG
jgi:DNA-binding transcriptional LysR family regulator